jgi:hypothetical protein
MNFLLYASLTCAYIQTNPQPDFAMNEESHKTLLFLYSQIHFTFPPYKLFYRTQVYQQTVIWHATAYTQRHQCVTSRMAYLDYIRVAKIIDSQMSEHSDITDKLL